MIAAVLIGLAGIWCNTGPHGRHGRFHLRTYIYANVQADRRNSIFLSYAVIHEADENTLKAIYNIVGGFYENVPKTEI